MALRAHFPGLRSALLSEPRTVRERSPPLPGPVFQPNGPEDLQFFSGPPSTHVPRLTTHHAGVEQKVRGVLGECAAKLTFSAHPMVTSLLGRPR